MKKKILSLFLISVVVCTAFSPFSVVKAEEIIKEHQILVFYNICVFIGGINIE